MEASLNIWETMAMRYPRFDDAAMSVDVRFVLDFAEENGISFCNKQILDIGAGTGTIAIPLAQRGSEKITSIDLCVSMLDILREDALKNNFHQHITTQLSDWKSFELPQTYDIVIASMTPAISCENDVKKMLSATHNVGIYVGWGAYKKNSFVDTLIQQHQQQKSPSSGGCVKVAQFTNFLEKQDIQFKMKYFETEWGDTFSLEEARKYAYDQLKYKNIEPNSMVIENLLLDSIVDGQISIKTEAQKGVVVFFMDNKPIKTFCGLK